ncbi:MAG: hypothetical protein ACF8QF_09200 [Phycisphaerales bacterium]
MHRITTLLTTLVACAAAALAGPAPATAATDATFAMPERLVVLGFTAGQLDPLRATLIEKNLIDEEGHWIGGSAHYVQLGDVMLFGDEVLPSLEMIHRLSQEASEAGGRVTFVLGPSLYMALRRDISNIPRENYDPMATEGSDARLEAVLDTLLEQLWEYNADQEESVRKRLRQNYADYYRRTHFPGAVEFMDAMGPDTELGQWLRQSPAVLRIGDLVLANGGVSEKYSSMSIDEINRLMLEDATSDTVWVPKMADLEAPLWWKELSSESEGNMIPSVRRILEELGADAMVVAHSPRLGESMLRVDNRVYHLQSGLSADADQEALIATLEVTPQRWLFTVGARKFETQAPRPTTPAPPQAPDDEG